MTTPTHYLIASGSVVIPKLDIALFTDTDEGAADLARPIVNQLTGAGYFQFTLHATPADGPHVQVETYGVRTPRPIVTGSRFGPDR